MAASAIHTYYCLCSTHLLTTVYTLSSLPQRAPPSLDRARILALPPFTNPIPPATTSDKPEQRRQLQVEEVLQDNENTMLPSLTSTSFRPSRKSIIVQRADGWEKRRVWRCGRCGIGVGYEVVKDRQTEEEKHEGETRILFLPEGGLIENGKWQEGEQG